MHPMFALEKVTYYFPDYQGLAFAYSFWHDQMEEMKSILYVIAGYRKITWTPEILKRYHSKTVRCDLGL